MPSPIQKNAPETDGRFVALRAQIDEGKRPGPARGDSDCTRARPRELEASAYHPMQTVGIGADARRSRSGAEGRVRRQHGTVVSQPGREPDLRLRGILPPRRAPGASQWWRRGTRDPAGGAS